MLAAWRLLTVIAALLVSACAMDETLPEAPAEGTLRLAAYNVHYIVTFRETGSWSMADWERRKGPLASAFKALDADIVALQEAESFAGSSFSKKSYHLDWLLAQNPGYAAAASGDPRVFPSTQPILYRRDRITAGEQGWFFFSVTPDQIYSPTYNDSYPAFASWAVFEDRETAARFRVVNVHFDFSSRENRRRSALLVAERIAPWIVAGETVFLLGDLNAGLGSQPVRILREAGLRFVPIRGSTWHINRGLNLTGPVDHIAATRDVRPLGDVIVLRRKFDGEWPSDHYPILADFRLR